jgi:hypothetical protein
MLLYSLYQGTALAAAGAKAQFVNEILCGTTQVVP